MNKKEFFNQLHQSLAEEINVPCYIIQNIRFLMLGEKQTYKQSLEFIENLIATKKKKLKLDDLKGYQNKWKRGKLNKQIRHFKETLKFIINNPEKINTIIAKSIYDKK